MSASVRGDEDRKELKAQWKAEVDVHEYDLKEVTQHKSKDDLWIIIHGKIYDITKYQDDHPGGAEALIEVAGTDATTAYEDVGHSEDAREIMNPYLVGVLKGARSQSPKGPVRVVRRGPSTSSTEVEKGSSVLQNAGYAVAIVGTIGALMTVRNSGPGKYVMSKLSHSFGGDNFGFAQGFLLASVVYGAVSLGVFERVSAAATITSGALKYPAHIKSTVHVPTHHPSGFLAPRDYKKLPLVKKEYLSPTIIKFVFELPTKDSVLGLPIGQHVAIKGHVDDHVVTRSYTPTSNNVDLGKLELVIRIYDDGLLTGKYLSKLEVGDEVEFRGPKGAMRYRKGWIKKLGMVCGGTGITPMYQLIRAICENDTDTTEVSLVYANRSEEDIILRDQLDHFAKAYPSNFKVTYMLDKPSEDWTGGKGYITKDVLEKKMPSPDSDSKVLLCGPPGMVNATKKNLIELDWAAPGAVSKMSDQIFCF